MLKRSLRVCSIGLLLGLATAAWAEPATGPEALLVVPARYRMIDMAFSLQALRPVVVVSYKWNDKTQPPELYLWSRAQWSPLTLDYYRSGQFLTAAPQAVVFVGRDLPPEVTALQPQHGRVLTLETFDLATIVNSLDAVFAFDSGEWTWLANRYSFLLTDLNANARQQSRYDKPRPPAEHRAGPQVILRPADVLLPGLQLSEPAEAPVAPAPAPAEELKPVAPATTAPTAVLPAPMPAPVVVPKLPAEPPPARVLNQPEDQPLRPLPRTPAAPGLLEEPTK